jgi:hypothetical protein
MPYIGHGEERELLYGKLHGDWQMELQRARDAGWGGWEIRPMMSLS